MPAADHPSRREHEHHPLELEAFYDDVISGVWCHYCMLPSAVYFMQFIFDTHTLKLYSTRRIWTCEECGEFTYSGVTYI